MQLHTVRVRPHFFHSDHDLAVLGEFGCVVAEVDQHLPQPQRITQQCSGQVGRDLEQQLQALVLGLQANHRGETVEYVLQAERHVFEAHPAGLDLGEVEDVVDDSQQVLR
ncbi:hypothetical protein D3C72_2112420 [compost metagenome]